MGKRRDERLVKLLAESLKTPMSNAVASGMLATSESLIPQLIGVTQQAPLAAALARDPSAFGGSLGPGYPFVPQPLDAPGPNGRPSPRKFQYDVADNLNITKKLTQWTTLASAATQVDIFARAITIRTGDVTKMDWSFAPSKQAINQIMDDNNCGYSEAAKIARQLTQNETVRLSSFWENPYPQSDRSWEEWITESMWQILTYDGWVLHPAYNLGGKLLGLDIIDASTIKILLDNYGDFVRPPDPGFQQILWGFPRGEFLATADKDLPVFLNGEYNISDRDQLSYFVMNRRTMTPYGLSPVEQALTMANIYLERQNWMLAEYKYGTRASAYLKPAETQEITLDNIAGWNRIFNDFLQGSNAERQQHVTLPPGMDVTFAPSIPEKYKSDYDEDLIKRTVSYFGVNAQQFGIIARAGLGGGKGAAEGMADNDETVSSKPQNKYIERSIMNASKRYLNASGMVQFSLKNDEGSEDEIEVANAGSTYISTGQKTINEVRSEQGLPLNTSPEADELMIITATGPVYLQGTLDAQLNPPEPPAPIIQQVPVDQNNQEQESSSSQEPQEQESSSGGKETPTDLTDPKKDEAKAFKRFASKNRGREFNFLYHTPEEAEILKAGLAPRPKSLITPESEKRRAEDEPSHAKITALAHAHAGFIRTAITAGVGGIAAAIAAASRHTTDLPEANLKQVARVAASSNVTFDNSVAVEMLGNLYKDAGKLGSQTAADALGVDVAPTRSTQILLDQANITLKGIDNTALGRISDSIANGISNGDAHGDIADAVNAIIDDPARADVIAITEANRAYNASFIDQLAANGETQFDWVNEDDPCPECEEQLGPHDITDNGPPLHPNCRCIAVAISDAPSVEDEAA